MAELYLINSHTLHIQTVIIRDIHRKKAPYEKIITLLLLIFGITSFTYAVEKYDTKSFRTVGKLCTSCHGTPFYMAKKIDDDDWEFYFNAKGKLEKLHSAKPKALANLKKGLFKNRKKRLLKFL